MLMGYYGRDERIQSRAEPKKKQKEKAGAKENTQIEMDFVKKLKFFTNIYEIFLHGITHKFSE